MSSFTAVTAALENGEWRLSFLPMLSADVSDRVTLHLDGELYHQRGRNYWHFVPATPETQRGDYSQIPWDLNTASPDDGWSGWNVSPGLRLDARLGQPVVAARLLAVHEDRRRPGYPGAARPFRRWTDAAPIRVTARSAPGRSIRRMPGPPERATTQHQPLGAVSISRRDLRSSDGCGWHPARVGPIYGRQQHDGRARLHTFRHVGVVRAREPTAQDWPRRPERDEYALCDLGFRRRAVCWFASPDDRATLDAVLNFRARAALRQCETRDSTFLGATSLPAHHPAGSRAHRLELLD